MTSDPPPQATRLSLRLVPHDICIRRQRAANGTLVVVASVECERRGRQLCVEHCVKCLRFVRIDVHEAGYMVLCRSAASEDSEDEREPAAASAT